MKKLLFTILALAALPGLASANIMRSGFGIGYTNFSGDGVSSDMIDSKVSANVFTEYNTTFLQNLFFGIEAGRLGAFKDDSDPVDKATWDFYNIGAYAKYDVLNTAVNNLPLRAFVKFGYGSYHLIAGKGNGLDDDTTGYNIGLGAEYYLSQNLAVSLGLTYHKIKWDEDWYGTNISETWKAKNISIGITARFGYAPTRNVRATENNVYEQVEQKASSKNTVIADPCDGLCPKTVPASVLNLNYNNQW